jgi:DNA-binding transcriptional ArsR family regulator
MSKTVSSEASTGSQDETVAEDSASEDGVTTDESDESVSRDKLFELLSNRRRRYALHHLTQADGSVELGDLARQVAAWENGTDAETVSSTERKSVYTSLQQFHLPKLAEKGLVEFDDREGRVELGPVVEDRDIYMEVVESGSVPWSQYYLAVAGVQAVVLAAVPLAGLSQFSAGAFCVIALAVSALAHTYYTKKEMRLGTSESPPDLEP